MNDIFDKCFSDEGYFGQLRISGDRFYTMPLLEPTPGRQMTYNGKKHIQWSINNYLGLAENEAIKQVAVDMAQKYGTSAPMGSRMMTGNTKYHVELEEQLADYIEKESAILFNYGYLGVIGTISSIMGTNDTILIDKLSHASMLDGTFMSQGKFRVFRHNDMDSLESHLKYVNRDRKGGILIITEGVFGMKGDLADLKGICELKEKYDARLFIDDAHGFGVMGEFGQGTGSHYNVQDKVDIYLGTFAKAFASIGGVAGARKEVIEWIRYNARTQVFAKSLPIIYVETLKKTLEIIRSDQNGRKKMWENSRIIKAGLSELGFNVGDVPSPICPVYVPAGDMAVGAKIVARLRKLGIFITAVVYPVVPKGIVLFRMIPTASHTDEDIHETIQAFKQVRDEKLITLDT